jgi:hypothetical protein
MTDNFNVQQTLKRQLAAQKHQDHFIDPLADDQLTSLRPKWLDTIQTPQEELAHRLTQHYVALLKQLPQMAINANASAQAAYMHTLVAELVKLYYLRMRFVELDTQLTAPIQQHRLTELAQDCKSQVLAVTQLMKQYIDYHGAK